MANPTDAGPTLPPGRYDAPRQVPVWIKALLTLGVLALVVPLAIDVLHRSDPRTGATLVAFDVLSDHRVTVTVDVTKPTGSAVVCTVDAVDFYSEVVGSGRVTIPAGTPGRDATVEFPTSDKAVAVNVEGCAAS